MKKIILGSTLAALFIGIAALVYNLQKTVEIDLFDVSWDDEVDLEDF